MTATAPVRRPRQTTIERFTETYHAYHEISADRRREQCKVLADYQAHAGVGLRKTTDKHLRAYLASLVASGQHPNTVRKKRSMILAFYGWCFDERLISAEVLMRARRVQNPRGATGDSLPKPYSREEIAQFWATGPDCATSTTTTRTSSSATAPARTGRASPSRAKSR
jgi:site-specific recombinase XerD